ncbi:MAG: DNA replication and repair protein RecF [Candidatus Chlorobium antarcticum]|nr:DNA replication and repair protein RecF [Candidatus Chlorobium antarcticum]
MRLRSIQLENFRNHRSFFFEPEEGINLIYGHNGSGKTSILEAAHYCALTKGFITASDGECLSFSADYFLLTALFESSSRKETTVRVSYSKENGKKLQVDGNEVKPFSLHIGQIPCISFAPSEIVIISGPPGERRRFLDNAVCQSDRRYLDNLLVYRRILQQRNALLLQLSQNSRGDTSMLAIWSENLAFAAASVTAARIRFLADFFPFVESLHRELSGGETPAIEYRSTIGKLQEDVPESELRERFLERFQGNERQERLRGQTLSGPHRDELLFLLDGRESKRFTSQGQQRTFLISLKLALFRYFNEKIGESPICLLDDIFSELDGKRTVAVLDMLEGCGQALISSAELKESPVGGGSCALHYLQTTSSTQNSET